MNGLQWRIQSSHTHTPGFLYHSWVFFSLYQSPTLMLFRFLVKKMNFRAEQKCGNDLEQQA